MRLRPAGIWLLRNVRIAERTAICDIRMTPLACIPLTADVAVTWPVFNNPLESLEWSRPDWGNAADLPGVAQSETANQNNQQNRACALEGFTRRRKWFSLAAFPSVWDGMAFGIRPRSASAFANGTE